jgi:hypothetical protein
MLMFDIPSIPAESAIVQASGRSLCNHHTISRQCKIAAKLSSCQGKRKYFTEGKM